MSLTNGMPQRAFTFAALGQAYTRLLRLCSELHEMIDEHGDDEARRRAHEMHQDFRSLVIELTRDPGELR